MTRALGALLIVMGVVGVFVVATRVIRAAGAPAPPAVMTQRTVATSAATPPAADVASERRVRLGDVRHHSARIGDIEPIDKPRPTRLRIAALGVDAPVTALGVAASGEMEVPQDSGTIAWYEHGPSPGQNGSAVLAGHVDYDGQPGVFFRLDDLRDGDTITVAFEGAGPRTFTVVDGASIAKTALPIDRLFRRTGRPVLTLITCGGEFDPARRSYRSNVVVRAVPSDDG
jgi:hypothetical protein